MEVISYIKISCIQPGPTGAPAVEVDDGNYIGGNAVKSLSEAPGGPMRHGSTSSFSENDYDSYWKVQEKKDAKLAKSLARDEANNNVVEMPSPKEHENDTSNVPQPSEKAAGTRDRGQDEPAQETPKPLAGASPGDTPAVPEVATPGPAPPTPAPTEVSESDQEDAKSSKGRKVKNKFDKYYYKNIGGIYKVYTWAWINIL